MKKVNSFWAFLSILMLAACSGTTNVQVLSPADFNSKINSTPTKLILDVRTPQEFEMDHIVGSTNLDIYESSFKNSLEGLDKNSPVFVYCKSGNRSSKASSILQDVGFKEVYELEGGVQNWKANNLPLETMEVKQKAPQFSLEEYNSIIDSNELVLVDFMAEWCGPCKRMSPYIEKFKEEYKGKLTVLQVDVDRNQVLSEHFKINGIPVIKIYNKGDIIFDQVGYQPEETLLTALEPHL